MLAIMNLELQKHHENMDVYHMVMYLKKLYQELASLERFDVLKALFQCKMTKESLTRTQILKIIKYIENFERLGFPLSQELAIDLVL